MGIPFIYRREPNKPRPSSLTLRFEITPAIDGGGKGPGSARHRGLPHPSLHHRRLVSWGRTQPTKSDAGAPVPKQAVQPTVQLGVKSVGLSAIAETQLWHFGNTELSPAFLRGFFCNRALCHHAGGLADRLPRAGNQPLRRTSQPASPPSPSRSQPSPGALQSVAKL